jgi:hypothetical protein
MVVDSSSVIEKETKLTIRLPRVLLDNASHYAREHGTTVPRLIVEYLRRIPTGDEMLEHAPIVKGLTGTLSSRLTSKDYEIHLEDKYG